MGELIARAAQGGVQVIVETHSDHILNGIRLCAKHNMIDPDIVRLYYFSRKKPIQKNTVLSQLLIIRSYIKMED